MNANWRVWRMILLLLSGHRRHGRDIPLGPQIASCDMQISYSILDEARRHIIECILDVRGISKIEPAACVRKLEMLTNDLYGYCRECTASAPSQEAPKQRKPRSMFRTVWNVGRRVISAAVVIADVGCLSYGIIDPASAALPVQLGQAAMEILPG